MLGAVVVHLQTQLGTRAHTDALDLVALADIHAVIRAPGAGYFAVLHRLGDLVRIQTRHHLLDLFDLAAVGYQHGVWRVNYQ